MRANYKTSQTVNIKKAQVKAAQTDSREKTPISNCETRTFA